MDNAELEALRELVGNQPADSPARLLLAEVDRLRDLRAREARARARADLQRTEHLTDAEVERLFIDLESGAPLEWVESTCRRCGGDGCERQSGSRFGGTFTVGRCARCRGRGTVKQLKIPEATP